jgi:predicted nucleic acid-binding protein
MMKMPIRRMTRKPTKVILDVDVWVLLLADKTLKEKFLKFKRKKTVFVRSDLIQSILKKIEHKKQIQPSTYSETETELKNFILSNSVSVQCPLKFDVLNEGFNSMETLECALTIGADYIVTCDERLLYQKYSKIIVTPEVFLKQLSEY